MSWLRYASPSRPGLQSVGRIAAGLVLVALLAGAVIAEPVFPKLTGRVVDEAGLLTQGERSAIEGELAALEAASTDQLVVVTLNSLQGYTIEDFGYRLGRAWGIGQKDKDNGVLLIVAPKDRKVRMEVGRGLEPVMTDAMSKLIIDNAILPAFRSGDFAGGIRAGVRDIKAVLLGDAEEVKARAKAPRRSSQPDALQIILFLFWLGIVLFVIWAVVRSSLHAQNMPGGRRRSGAAAVPGSSGGWSGGWSGGGGDGGGWSGGGGGFGGGGSSGSW